ncbi:hypothetical protein HK405_006887, partial [Cladochytrium tenue]
MCYPLSGYTFGSKDPQPEEDTSVSARLLRLQNEYEQQGVRHTVEGVLVVHEHGHPHILMLQIANTFFKLPGDTLKPGEDQIEGLKKRLSLRLAPGTEQDSTDWEVELLSVPRNMKLLAVPLFELYDNAQRYGPQLSALPHLLS